MSATCRRRSASDPHFADTVLAYGDRIRFAAGFRAERAAELADRRRYANKRETGTLKPGNSGEVSVSPVVGRATRANASPDRRKMVTVRVRQSSSQYSSTL